MKFKKMAQHLLLSLFVLFTVTSCAGIISSLKETGSAALEDPSVEKQLNRISLGINIIKTNHDILYNMPVSSDAEWVDKIVAEITDETKKRIEGQLKEDPYYATVAFTDRIKQQRQNKSGINNLFGEISPLTYQFYNRMNALYTDIDIHNNIPDIYQAPTCIDEYKQFKDVKLIEVEAQKGTRYPNVEEAVIALTPDPDTLKDARSEWNEKMVVVAELKQTTSELEAFIDDDNNVGHSELEEKKEELAVKKVELENAEKSADEQESIYSELLKEAVVVLESEYDPERVPLAKKLDKLLEAVDTGAVQAGVLFTTAIAKMTSSIEQIEFELKVFEDVKLASWFHGNDTIIQQMNYRQDRIVKNAIYAIPNITIGSYYAVKQSLIAGKYQKIVEVILDAYEAEQKQS